MSNLNNLNSPEKTASLFFRMQTLVLNGEKCMIHFVPASRFSYASQTHRDARAVRIHRTLRGSQWHFSAGFDWHAVDQWEHRSHPLVFSLWPMTAVGAAVFGCGGGGTGQVSMGREFIYLVQLNSVVSKYLTKWNEQQTQKSIWFWFSDERNEAIWNFNSKCAHEKNVLLTRHTKTKQTKKNYL